MDREVSSFTIEEVITRRIEVKAIQAGYTTLFVPIGEGKITCQMIADKYGKRIDWLKTINTGAVVLNGQISPDKSRTNEMMSLDIILHGKRIGVMNNMQFGEGYIYLSLKIFKEHIDRSLLSVLEASLKSISLDYVWVSWDHGSAVTVLRFNKEGRVKPFLASISRSITRFLDDNLRAR